MITDDEVFHSLYGLTHQMHKLSKRKHSGIFLGQGKIIYILALSKEPLSQRELADKAKVKPGSLTEVLERLERDQMIKRERLAEDRRVIHVRLTEEGQKAYQKMRAERHQFGRNILSGINQDELATFVKVINSMESNLHHYYGERLPQNTKEGDKND
ncbi:MAG: MarR family transcriptional regulator [Candidatus Limosilactobacillus merdavium]|uniref:MarR family transcriptional regulator n=1 Tax=Candidatus Limosilactobacillus merdavium TaxID=2838651 RepID=A0A9E2NVK6_9LACO|nr:MarR family transcriptional regulator [Candidatus Limosilactobacillus merdavium]